MSNFFPASSQDWILMLPTKAFCKILSQPPTRKALYHFLQTCKLIQQWFWPLELPGKQFQLKATALKQTLPSASQDLRKKKNKGLTLSSLPLATTTRLASKDLHLTNLLPMLGLKAMEKEHHCTNPGSFSWITVTLLCPSRPGIHSTECTGLSRPHYIILDFIMWLLEKLPLCTWKWSYQSRKWTVSKSNNKLDNLHTELMQPLP